MRDLLPGLLPWWRSGAAGVARTSRFGVSDGDAAAAGLTCGGTIEVLVEPVDRTAFPHLPALAAGVSAGTGRSSASG
jgi:xanthine dehydrogenase accessory factor